MEALLIAGTSIILILNFFAGLIGGIWLLFLGEWVLVFASIAAIIIVPFLISFAISPFMLFGIRGIKQAEQSHFIKSFSYAILSLLGTYSVIAIWCIYVFNTALSLSLKYGYGDHILKYYIPLMLFAYSVATSPIRALATDDIESGNIYTAISTFVFCLASAVVLAIGYAGLPFWGLILIFVIAVAMLLAMNSFFYGMEIKR